MNSETLALLVIVAAIGALWLYMTRRSSVANVPSDHPRCPSCSAALSNVGFLSWNGGAAGDLNMVTTGVAAPAQAFVDNLKAAWALAPQVEAPEGGAMRMVGSMELFVCGACDERFVRRDKQPDVQPLSDHEWGLVTGGASPAAAAGPDADLLRRLEGACDARRAAYEQLGTLDPTVLAAQIDDGPPFWPGRRAYQWIRGDGYACLATWGLADPWNQPGVPGYGVEFFIEVPEAYAEEPWVFAALSQVVEGLIAPPADFRARLDHFGTLSNEVRGDGFPTRWVSSRGRVGVVFGVPGSHIPTSFQTPDGDVRLVPVTILLPSELDAIIHTDGARDSIATELALRPRGHACDPERTPASCND